MRVLVGAWLFASLAFPMGIAAEPLPQSVLVLDQSVPLSPFSRRFTTEFLSELTRTSPTHVTIYPEFLDLGRFGSPDYDTLVQTYLEKKYRDIRIGVIVALGSEAFKLLLRLHPEFSYKVPIVVTTFDEAATAKIRPSANTTGTIIPLSFRNMVRTARALVPDLKKIVLVGDPFERQPFRRHYRQELKELTGNLEVIDLSGLAIEEVKARVAVLPDDAAILFTTIYKDAAGIQFNIADTLQAISGAANRPIVVDSEVNIGPGSTGGFVVSPEDAGRESAHLAARILSGEAASEIPVTVKDLAKPVFDNRQLERWNVSETMLPPGSEIRFRQFTVWGQYRLQIVAIAIVIIFQSALIAWLVIEHRRRRVAEIEGQRSLLQVTQLDLALTASAMSASMAHELNQPLTAIMSNTEAAEMLLAANVPDIKQVQEILADIHRDDQRATDIIRHLRKLLKHDDQEVQDVDLNALIADTVDMLEPEASGRGVVLAFDPGPHKIMCRADPVRLQQVILNLSLNGMDAMQDCAGERKLTFLISSADESEVMVSAADTGVGIPEGKLQSIFEPLVTMKQQGSGLGLFIARTIINTYGGRIWAENRIGGGAIFHFTLVRALALTA